LVINANWKENEMFVNTLSRMNPRIAAAILSVTTLGVLYLAPLAEAGNRRP